MIRALVVDDEPLSRSSVVAELRVDLEVALAGECGSGIEALAEIRRLRPELVFLDVEMPECGGFDVLEMLGGNVPPAIVFVTAYDQYAIQAFEVGALDYLLKPFDRARFMIALKRAKERIAASRAAPRTVQRLAIKSIGGITFVNIAEIDWIEASDYYSRLHAGGKTHLIRRSMADLEKDLHASAFRRVHRSTIVNIDRVRALVLNDSGEYDVRLRDGSEHRVSRSHLRALQVALERE
ncbi:MAG TPA: LytTR family transcriptional regulator DNA-binding domain-containing protein [Candidatus Eremiobacteraceae bacterium]|jgi:two-component system LytT family response regulator